MWVMTTHGFVSAVAVDGTTNQLLVRGRDYESVAAVAETVGIAHERVFQDLPADYPWRLRMTRKQFKRWLAAEADGVDYPNFKNAAKKTRGEGVYIHFLMSVWSTGHMLTTTLDRRSNEDAWRVWEQTYAEEEA